MTSKLPLSSLNYKISEIDESLAKKLPVYCYTLPRTREFRWKTWMQHLSSQITKGSTPYFVRTEKDRLELYVVLQESQNLTITTPDGIEIQKEVALFSKRRAYIYLRLIMRMALNKSQFDLSSDGKIIRIIKSSKSSLQGLTFDCGSQQLNDKDTYELTLTHKHVLLVKAKDKKMTKGLYWEIAEKDALRRSSPSRINEASVYVEIAKNKSRKLGVPFVDLDSLDKFENSLVPILSSNQELLMKEAAEYGFKLSKKVLSLSPVNVATKYSPGSAFKSIQANSEVLVMDLRVSTRIKLESVIKGDQFKFLGEFTEDSLKSFDPAHGCVVLTVLDQRKGVVGDRYPWTKKLAKRCAVQHININPFDEMSVNSKEYTVEADGHNETYLAETEAYYQYALDDIEKHSKIGLKLEVCLKELVLKSMIINQQPLSQVLPAQSRFFDGSMMVISEGIAFGAINNRAAFSQLFQQSELYDEAVINELLKSFDLKDADIFNAAANNWPYHFRPEGLDSWGDNRDKFLNRLTFVIQKKAGKTSIFMQDPSFNTPKIIPTGVDRARKNIKDREKKVEITSWVVNPDNIKAHNKLIKGLDISEGSKENLELKLPSFIKAWNQALAGMRMGNVFVANYKSIKKEFRKEYSLSHGSPISTLMIGAWDAILSEILNKKLRDEKRWLKDTPGMHKIWTDLSQGFVVVGSVTSPQSKLERQPSIRQWHAIKGGMDIKFIAGLLDVDWMRKGQFAGNPFPCNLIRKWLEIA